MATRIFQKGSKYEIATLTILGWWQFWQPHNAPKKWQKWQKPRESVQNPGKGAQFCGEAFSGGCRGRQAPGTGKKPIKAPKKGPPPRESLLSPEKVRKSNVTLE